MYFCIQCTRIHQSSNNSMVSCQKGPTCHAYAWQIGPFWQDTLDICHPLRSIRSCHTFLYWLPLIHSSSVTTVTQCLHCQARVRRSAGHELIFTASPLVIVSRVPIQYLYSFIVCCGYTRFEVPILLNPFPPENSQKTLHGLSMKMGCGFFFVHS